MATLETIKDRLKTPRDIVITTHFKPDGDALGSSLAMHHWLRNQGHRTQVIVPSDFPYFLNWMPGREDVRIYTDDRAYADKAIAEADIVICLDFNGLGRTNAMEGSLAQTSALKWMIDHHLAPEGFDDVRFWDSSAAATAQLVYRLIVQEFDDGEAITPHIATCLYTGIMTDTGSFRFRSTTSEIHTIVADLIQKGAQNWLIHEHIYNSNTEKRLRFLGFCLAERLTVDMEYHTAWFALSREDLEKFSIGTGDTEGLVNYALSIQGIKLATLIIDRGDLIKFSFRSLGEFPCNELSQKHFHGGGHLNAAGGSYVGDFQDAVKKFKSILPEYKDLLILQTHNQT